MKESQIRYRIEKSAFQRCIEKLDEKLDQAEQIFSSISMTKLILKN